jgi:ATPase subunit of ABC transporter with duplicated ATPase domains
MIIASHDRYLVERVCDTVFALFGDGRLTHLPGGLDEYLSRIAAPTALDSIRRAGQRPGGRILGEHAAPTPTPSRERDGGETSAGDARAAKKELARLERQVSKLEQREAELHEQLAGHATDYEKVSTLDAELRRVQSERAAVEEQWLELADRLG